MEISLSGRCAIVTGGSQGIGFAIPANMVRVVVASAAFPKYDRNLNTGGDNERDTRYIVVRQRILHDKAHASFVRLPIIPR